MENRILLIEPPFNRLIKFNYSLDTYPLSLGYLAGAIKKETTWDVQTYNADFFQNNETLKVSYMAGAGFKNYLKNLEDATGPIWQEVRSVIRKYDPTVIGISSKSQNFASACIVAGLAKEYNNRIIVIVGGPHSSMVGPDVLKCMDIDISVKGEGERTIVELLSAIRDRKDFNNMPGIVYRKDGKVIENSAREFIQDLDTLAFPHENAPTVLRDFKQYPLGAFKSIFAARGCPHNCMFCGSHKIWSRRVRFRSPANIVKEIKLLRQKGLKFVYFEDDTFGTHKKHIQELCTVLVEQCPGLKWGCEIHVQLVDDEIVQLMKKAGCYAVAVGIESGNNEILKAMKKNITIEQAFSACRVLKKHGMLVSTFFMVGFPQETEETLQDTFRAMKKIPCDTVVYSIFTPYPGTEMFAWCKEQGIVTDAHDASRYFHQSPENCFCANIAPERFRELVSGIEKIIDRRNAVNMVKRIFALSTIRKIQEFGIKQSIRRGMQVLFGK